MQSFHSCRKVFLSLHCRVHHFAAKQSVRSLPAHSPFRHRSQWYLRVMENLSRGRWTGFSHQLLFYISMLRSSFAKRHNFWSKPLRQKNRVKILKLNVKGEYEWIIMHLGLQKPKWNLKTRETWAEKKLPEAVAKSLNQVGLQVPWKVSAVDSKLSSLFNLNISLPHPLTWPFIQPKLGWLRATFQERNCFLQLLLTHFEKRIKSFLWPSIQAC